MQQKLTSKRVNTIPKGHVCQKRPTTTFQVMADKRVKKTQQVHQSHLSESRQLEHIDLKQRMFSRLPIVC